MTTLFTSDLHFGHTNILKYAPQRFDYLGLRNTISVSEMSDEHVRSWVPEMNEGIVRLWNSQVDPGDIVFVIGDVAMGKVAETIEYVRRLNGRKVLVMGNHDRPHPIMHKSDEKTAEWHDVYTDVGFERISMGFVHDFDGVTAQVSHFPYEGDHTEEERYGAYRPPNMGLPLVHGHVHDAWDTNGVQYNVGIDAWNGQFQTEKQIGDYFRSLGFGE